MFLYFTFYKVSLGQLPWLLLLLLRLFAMLATTENIETVMERKAICERETAAESAREGQDSAPAPPSKETYITPFLPLRLLRPSLALM